MVDIPSGDAWQRLAQQRRILVGRPLDRTATATPSAQLMALDGESTRDVEIVINSEGGPLSDIFAGLRSRLSAMVAAAIGRDEAIVADEIEHGRELDAEAALALGIIDTVIDPPSR